MAKFTKGATFTDGVENNLTSAKLHALIESAEPTVNLITDQTAVTTPAATDQFFVYDASGNALGKVSYSVLETALAAAVDSQTSIAKTVSQTAHGFIVGDVIGMDPDGDYGKVNSFSEVATSVSIDTGNDRITLTSGHSLVSADRCWFSAGPTAFSQARVYYAKAISTDVFEFYEESSLTTKVTIDDTTAATIYHGLPNIHAVGVVSTVVDANSFTLTYGGEVTGLVGLTAGRVYYLDVVAGTVTSDVDNLILSYAVPVYVALSSSTAFVFPSPPAVFAEGQIKRNDLADNIIDDDKLETVAATFAGSSDEVLFRDADNGSRLSYGTLVKAETATSGNLTIPAAGGTVEFTHGLTGEPQVLRVVLVRTDAADEAGYAQGDEVGIEACHDSDDTNAPFAVLYDASDTGKVKITRGSQNSIRIVHATSGVPTNINTNLTTDWALKVYAVYYA